MFYNQFTSKLSSTAVFIDTSIQDYSSLIEGLNRDVDVYVVDQQPDAIEQITDVLKHHSNLESVHIVSHGTPGCLYLGNTELSLNSLEYYQSLLQQWFSASTCGLSPSLVIYGCNAAAGDAGEEFFAKLRHITGAQLYGAAQKVGSPDQGGTWQLTSQLDSAPQNVPPLPFNERVIATYPGTFAPQLFDEYGLVSTIVANERAFATSLFFDDDGHFFVGGGSSQTAFLVRHNSDGSVDSDFADNGLISIDAFSSSFGRSRAIQSIDNKFILIGVDNFSSTFSASCFNSDGTLDSTFGNFGAFEVDIDFLFDIDFFNSVDLTTDASGKIIAVGILNGDISIARFNTNGSLDSSFGSNGVTVTDFGGSFEVPQTILVDQNGKLIVSGHASNGSTNDFLLVRYNSDGSLDEDFGEGGRTLTDFGGTNDLYAHLTIDSNGQLLLSGRARDAVTGNDDFALARYNGADGSLDSNFGTNGLVRVDLGGGAEYGEEVVEVADGALIQKGQRVSTRSAGGGVAFDYQSVFLRYDSDGNLDRSFGNDGVGQGISGPLAVDDDGRLFGALGNNVVRYDDVLDNTETFLSWETSVSGGNFGQVSAVSLSPIGAASKLLGRSITDLSWQFQAAGDFNGDGQEDVVLRQFGFSNQTLLWTMDEGGTAIASEKFIGRPVEDPSWSIQGAADFNGDGNTDLLLRNATADQNVVWYLDAQQNIASEELIGRGFQDNDWKIVATNDFNADGAADILLRNELSTQLLVWQLNGAQIEAEYLAGRTIPDTNWRVEGSRDFNNDGHADLLIRNAFAQRAELWLMENGQIQYEIPMGGVPSGGAQLLV